MSKAQYQLPNQVSTPRALRRATTTSASSATCARCAKLAGARFAEARNPAVTRRTCSGGETGLSVGSGRLGTCLAQSGRAQSPSGWSRFL